jgi:S-disulfanyl-L-cysteine oxidoreductase SoxD
MRHVIAVESPGAMLQSKDTGRQLPPVVTRRKEYNFMSGKSKPGAHRRRFRIAFSVLLIAGVTAGKAVLAADATRSDGWYTPDQAAHGHVTFNSYCAQCHRPDLKGALGPALVGGAFLNQWINKPLGNLFEFVHTKMPANNPGSVPDDKLWNITAYILQKNGFAEGSTPLGEQKEGKTLVKPPQVAAK